MFLIWTNFGFKKKIVERGRSCVYVGGNCLDIGF